MSIVNDIVDRVYYINLDFRPERNKDILNELSSLKITNYERFSAIKPDESILKTSRKSFLPRKPLKYRVGALGCLFSHLEIIKDAKSKGYDRVLILEDDTIFKRDLKPLKDAISQLKNKKLNFELLYLAGTHITRPKKISGSLVRCIKTYTTNSYIIDKSIYDFIIEGLKDYNEEVDVFYATKVQTRGKSYCVRPHITRQRPGYSDIMHTKRDNKLKDP